MVEKKKCFGIYFWDINKFTVFHLYSPNIALTTCSLVGGFERIELQRLTKTLAMAQFSGFHQQPANHVEQHVSATDVAQCTNITNDFYNK